MPSILLENDALNKMLRAAMNGYEMPYKEERLGFLFGEKINNGRMEVTDAVVYHGGNRTRTMAEYDNDKFIARGKELSAELGQKWIGCFHSHVEMNDRPSHGISPEDKYEFRELATALPDYEIEMIVSIYAAGNYTKGLAPRSKSLLVNDNNDYRYLVKGYKCYDKGIYQIPVKKSDRKIAFK